MSDYDELIKNRNQSLDDIGAHYLVAIRDSVAGTYFGVHVETNKEVAIRNFRLACQNENLFSSSPADFSLYVIGRFVPESGSVFDVEHELLISAFDIIKTVNRE